MLHASSYPALVLNADYRPLDYHPLSTWTWMDALKAKALGRVHVVAEYEAVARSPSEDVRLPAVLVLKRYVRQPERPKLTRLNLWLRDGGACVYCRVPIATGDLTFDHVMPRSRGGDSTWRNIACACFSCNGRKANRTPEEAGMALAWPPREPTKIALAASARLLGRAVPVREEWTDFMYWESELER